MIFHKTKIEDLYIIEPELKTDDRGFFAESFRKDELSKLGIEFDVMQTNMSFNKEKGILRGMHFQKSPKAEDKIVQCVKGIIYDVAIDLRQGSSTYGQWVAQELSEENKKMFLIPKGFAHGFETLADNCEVHYLMSEFYSQEHKSGVRFDDPFFNIAWPIKNPVVSEKDKNWPLMK